MVIVDLKSVPSCLLGWVKIRVNVLKSPKLVTFSGPPPPGSWQVSKFDKEHEMYLLCTNVYLSRKFGAPKIARGGMEGWRKVPKVVPFEVLRGLVPGAQLLWDGS